MYEFLRYLENNFSSSSNPFILINVERLWLKYLINKDLDENYYSSLRKNFLKKCLALSCYENKGKYKQHFEI